MQITVYAFATLRERLNRSKIALEVPQGVSVGSLWEYLGIDSQESSRWSKQVLFAINREYVSSDTLLHEGDEVALIPPVAGG
ncbi:MAG: MoaD/ThiS family protein [Deltaproteobacteria bacterium]|nr:MoaD/ThiS family protein [Deltaproteobacteria bacterium]